MLTTVSTLSPASIKALRQLASGTPSELVNTRSLYALERIGLVQWADDHYGRELSPAGHQVAADLERAECNS